MNAHQRRVALRLRLRFLRAELAEYRRYNPRREVIPEASSFAHLVAMVTAIRAARFVWKRLEVDL